MHYPRYSVSYCGNPRWVLSSLMTMAAADADADADGLCVRVSISSPIVLLLWVSFSAASSEMVISASAFLRASVNSL